MPKKLGCWKKIIMNKNHFIYKKTDVPRGTEISISRHHIPKTNIELYWGVSIWKTNQLKPSIQDKLFENKKEALSYANKYMKKYSCKRR